jgi:hypothetical protein
MKPGWMTATKAGGTAYQRGLDKGTKGTTQAYMVGKTGCGITELKNGFDIGRFIISLRFIQF